MTKVKQFYSEVEAEMKKVSWPTRQELTGSAMVVLISVGILALFIGIIDFMLSRFVTTVLR